MANFCNKCGSPVSGVFCVKCGADTRVSPAPPQPATTPTPPVEPVANVPTPFSPASASAGSAPARFCNACGSPSSGAAFCNQCGADMRQAATPPIQPAAPAAPVSAAPAPVSSVPAKGSPLTKILVGFAVVVLVIGALAAGGVYYVVHRVKEKVHEIARDLPGGSESGSGIGSSGNNARSSSGGDSNISGYHGDACGLLSKAEVGRAIGVEIVAAQSADEGCSYLAKGNSGDMTAKHMTAMAGTRGADAQQQKMIQSIAGGFFKTMQSESHEPGSDSNGNVPVFTFLIDTNAAETQMQLNQRVMGSMGPGTQSIAGIGDEAFDVAGASMMFRKGDKMVRIMYSTCPCTVEAIKPLAQTLAARL